MPCDIQQTNWLTSFKSRISCGIDSIPVDQIRTGIIGLQIETLLCKCPSILASDTEPTCDISNSLTLSQIYARIKCGTMLTETEAAWAQANIYIKEKACCDITDEVDGTDVYEIFASGIHSWAGGAATTDSIAVAGLVATDIVTTTLVARGGAEILELAVNDHANDQIDLTLSANGTNGTTKVSYQVLRLN